MIWVYGKGRGLNGLARARATRPMLFEKRYDRNAEFLASSDDEDPVLRSNQPQQRRRPERLASPRLRLHPHTATHPDGALSRTEPDTPGRAPSSPVTIVYGSDLLLHASFSAQAQPHEPYSTGQRPGMDGPLLFFSSHISDAPMVEGTILCWNRPSSSTSAASAAQCFRIVPNIFMAKLHKGGADKSMLAYPPRPNMESISLATPRLAKLATRYWNVGG